VLKRPLVIHVSDPDSGDSRDYVFETSPVVVGRGEGVQLCLDRPFVSLQHGTFDFDDAQVTYVDLESRNGTVIDGGARADRPVALSEETDLRIGKLRLRISRVAPVKAVGAPGPDPFAPKAARGPAKGTDALPREELERIRRELVAPKEVPVMPPVVPQPTPPPAARPLNEPALEKTVPVPSLTSRPLPEVPTNAPVAPPYAPGGTQAVPALPRPPGGRRTPRASEPRLPRQSRPRKAISAPPRRSRGPWLPIAVGIILASTLAVLLLSTEGRERRPPIELPRPDPTLLGGPAGSGDPPPPAPVLVPAPQPQVPSRQPTRPGPLPKRQPTARPAPHPAPPEKTSSPNRSPILP
jgi:hypothetical protein